MRVTTVGWDGGGTGTTVLCLDEEGAELGRARFGPLNLNGGDPRAVEQTVKDALSFMRAFGECGCLCVGAAGVSNRRFCEALRATLARHGYAGKLLLAGDHEIALAGAVGDAGLVLIAGTGSICFGRNEDGQTARSGGAGHLLDDEGSGYAIGRDILSAVLRAEDGRSGPTALAQGVRARLGSARREDVVAYAYQENRTKSDIAALAPLLAPAVAQGDEAALRIAHRAAKELCLLVKAVSRRLRMPSAELAMLGSILTQCEPVRAKTAQAVTRALPGVTLIPPRGDAAEGAARLALAAQKKEEENPHA